MARVAVVADGDIITAALKNALITDYLSQTDTTAQSIASDLEPTNGAVDCGTSGNQWKDMWTGRVFCNNGIKTNQIEDYSGDLTTFINDVSIGANLLKTTNLALKEGTANQLYIRNAADDAFKSLVAYGGAFYATLEVNTIADLSGGAIDCTDATMTLKKTGHTPQTSTLGVGVTTLALTSDFLVLTGDGGGNNLATITGGVAGQRLTILCVDALVTFVNDDTHAANTIDLVGGANLVSADDTILELISDGTSWYECSRSVN